MNKQKLSKEAGAKPDGYTLLADAIFRPILFSTPMVQAILDGRKTQTRRIIKTDAKQIEWMPIVLNGYGGFCDEHGNPEKPKYKIGEILWVRETFLYFSDENCNDAILYRADKDANEFALGLFEYKPKWKPSIFMPKEACRIFLEVTDVRVERLQDISVMDAINEGIQKTWISDCERSTMWKNYINNGKGSFYHPVKSFSSLWESINGRKSWDKNPWVWVYEFKRIERPSGFC